MASASSSSSNPRAYYRHDGVRITHDPYSAEMSAKYGAPGETDNEGFDPYADTVGSKIYSGAVKRCATTGSVLIGEQYQNHNPRPGPIPSGGGYTPVSRAIASFKMEMEANGGDSSSTTLAKLLDKHPDLVNDVATGGALPLHTCGMSRDNQMATAFIISRGGDIEAIDTYGFTPLDRMASNNLPTGAKALLEAGAHPNPSGKTTRIATQSEAREVLEVLTSHGPTRRTSAKTQIKSLTVYSEIHREVAGTYSLVGGEEIPKGFALVCEQNDWNTQNTWKQLNGGEGGGWYKHDSDGGLAYVYFNAGDKMWWIDGPDGKGVYKGKGPNYQAPGASIRYEALDGGADRPTLAFHRQS